METKKQMQHTFLLSFDVEEFTVPEEQKGFLTEEEREAVFQRGAEGLKRCISLLKQQNVVATCFCTSEFVRKYPPLIKELQSQGCEIALHGYAHRDQYQTMEGEHAFSSLSKAKEEIEKIVPCKIKGFRGPGFRVPKPGVLEKIGLLYDSSLHPTYVPTKYNHLKKSRKIQKYGNIMEIPISVVPFVRLSFSWIWFRNFPLVYTKFCTLLNKKTSNYTLLYFHPWEFVDLKNRDWGCKGLLWSLITGNTGERMTKKLEEYVIWAKKRGTFKTITAYLSEQQGEKDEK